MTTDTRPTAHLSGRTARLVAYNLGICAQAAHGRGDAATVRRHARLAARYAARAVELCRIMAWYDEHGRDLPWRNREEITR